MELSDRAILYVILSPILMLFYDGWMMVIVLWIHFYWCVQHRKEVYKQQEETLREMRESGKYNLDCGKPLKYSLPSDKEYLPHAECHKKAFEEALAEAIAKLDAEREVKENEVNE